MGRTLAAEGKQLTYRKAGSSILSTSRLPVSSLAEEAREEAWPGGTSGLFGLGVRCGDVSSAPHGVTSKRARASASVYISGDLIRSLVMPSPECGSSSDRQGAPRTCVAHIVI